MVQTSNLIVSRAWKKQKAQTSNWLFPGPGKSKMVQTSNLLFPGPAKSKMVQTSNFLFFLGKAKGSDFQFAFSRAGKKQNGSDFQFAFSRAGKKQNGPDFQFAFSAGKKQNGSDCKMVQTSNLLFPGLEKSKMVQTSNGWKKQNGSDFQFAFFPGQEKQNGSGSDFQIAGWEKAMWLTDAHWLFPVWEKQFTTGKIRAHNLLVLILMSYPLGQICLILVCKSDTNCLLLNFLGSNCFCQI